ncbi:GntR family transcriptional regulator [Marispirochaeta aestuarii]|nr:GntR family transcriptional regulator [Marispirochaeta aestuarii]
MKEKTALGSHDIYTTLFDRIIHNQYPSENFLREDSLAKEFGTSRTPIRNVLKRLEQDQLIQIIPNRGAKTFPFTADDLEDIFEIRRSLEALALEFAIPALSIQRLIEIRKEIQEISNTKDYMRHAEVDAELHTYLIESCGRRRLINMVNQLYHLIQTFRELGFRDNEVRTTTCEEHLRLIDAICVRDTKLAIDVLKTHIQNSKVRIMQKVVRGQVN